MAVLGVAWAATRSDGRPGTQATTNDGGAWLLNRDAGAIGHMNREVLEITAGVRVADGGADFDVDQAGDVILTHDRSTDRVILIDGRTNRSQGEFVVPSGATVKATPDGAVISVSDPGLRVWRVSLDRLLDLVEIRTESPTFASQSNGAVALAFDGAAIALDADAESLYWIDASANGDDASISDVVALDAFDADFESALTTVVGDVVVLSDEGELIVAPRSGESRSLSRSESIVTLQQAGPQRAVVSAIDDERRLLEIDLVTGETTEIVTLDGVRPLPFIVHGGCSFVVTTGAVAAEAEATFVKVCGGEIVEQATLDGAGAELRLRLVNNWVWINDIETGGAWITSPDSELSRIDDWGAALAEDNLDESEATTEDGGGIEEVRVNPDAADAELVEADELDDDNENDPPVIRPDEAQTRIDRPVVIPVLANDEDADGDVLLITEVAIDGPPGALASITPSRDSVQLSPPAGYTGTITFTYVATDGRGGEGDATVTVEVTSGSIEENRPPEAVTDVAAARAGSAVSFDVLANDTDPDGDALVLLDVTGEGGTLIFDPSGQVSFTPDTTGTEARIDLTYTVADDFGAVADGRIIVNVRLEEANSSPDARNDSAVTSVGNPARLNVLDNDNDPDDDALIVARQPILIRPEGSEETVDAQITTAQITTDGEFFFIPTEPGTYIFEYLVSDGQNSDKAQIRIDVAPADVNEPPVAVRDDVTIPIGGTRLVYALDNDGDPNGDVVGIVEWSGTQGLVVEEIPGIGFRVTVEPGAPDRATFRYAISDGVNEPVGTVVVVAVVDVEPINQPPIVQADSIEVRAGRTTTVPVLINDYDPEGGALEVIRVPELLGVDAQFEIGPGGQTIDVTVGPGVTSGFTFGYDVADPDGATSASIVDVRIIAPGEPNRAPVARPDVGRTIEDTSIAVDVLVNDSDPDGDAIRVESIASQPANGEATINPDGTIRYEPITGFTGTDSFGYVLLDTEGERSIGVVQVGVTALAVENRQPSANPDVFGAIAGSETLVLDVLANDFDPDNDRLTVLSVTPTGRGSVRVAEDGSVVYDPPSEIVGESVETSFSYSIADDAGNESEATVTITIELAPEPVAPVAVNDQAGPVRARSEVTVDVRANDLDADGDPLDLVVTSTDPGLSVIGSQLVIVAGTESSQHSYTVTDPDGLSSTGTVTVFVVDNEAPTVAPLEEETPYETSISLELASLASDVDEDPLFFVCCDNTRGGITTITASGEGTLNVTFEPSPGFSGPAGFSFSVDDQEGHLVSGAVSINVLPPDNRPPTAADGTISVEAGSLEKGIGVPFDLAGLVDDPDIDDTFTFTTGDAPGSLDVATTGGQLTIAAPATAAGESGSISYTVTDSFGASASGTLTVTVTPISDPPPQTVADSGTTNQGTSIEIDVLGNDIDPLGQGLTIFQIGATTEGTTAAGAANGSVVFTPNNDFFGTASFTYTIRDAADSVDRETVGQVTVDVIGRPAIPAPPSANADNAVATITWTTPTANGAPVEEYQLEYEDITGGGTQTVTLGIQNSHTWTGLTNGNEYRFRVQARNVAGWSEWSGWSAAVRPDTIADAPAAPTVAFADGQLGVTWTAPNNQGSAITGYKLEIGSGASQVVTLGAGTTYDWTSLTNGVEYQFRVAAVNAAGDSDWSGWSAPEHPLGPPLGPAMPVAETGDRFLDVTWSAPDNNGDAILSYELEIQGGATVTVTGGGTTSYRWADLQNGVDQQFRVRALNRDPNPGTWSTWSVAAKPCAIPDQVGVPSATRGDTDVALTWTAPNAQGCAITGYTIVANGSITQTAGAGATSHTFTGLTNGTPYTFTIVATNEIGDSVVSSASASVTPAGPPTAPSINAANPDGVGRIALAFSGATPNGSPITSYELSTNSGGAVPIGAGLTHNATGLAESTNYGFRVRACNVVGCSPWSGTANATTWGRPGAPALSGSAGNGSISVNWSAPGNNGGSTISNYNTTISPNASGTIGGNSASWTGLANNVTHTVSVSACNAVGCGPAATINLTPVPPPPVVTVSRGSVYTGPGCAGTCNRVFVDAQNFGPNETVTIACYSSIQGTPFLTYTRTADGNGRSQGEQCFYGFPGDSVWATVSSATRPVTQSNTIIW